MPRLLDELLLMLQTLLLDAGVEVRELSLPDDLPELQADAVQLQQVIST